MIYYFPPFLLSLPSRHFSHAPEQPLHLPFLPQEDESGQPMHFLPLFFARYM
jgi:hypothetical protein